MVRSIAIDIAAHSIQVNAMVGDRPASLLFKGVSAFHFDSKLGIRSSDEEFSWENIELSEIHFIPELPITKQQLADPQNIGYNFLLELYSSAFLIRAKYLQIDEDQVLG